jgi:hypothetical protein
VLIGLLWYVLMLYAQRGLFVALQMKTKQAYCKQKTEAVLFASKVAGLAVIAEEWSRVHIL